MNIENIIDYVNETPHNTNIGILRNKLELYNKEIIKGTVKSVNGIPPDEQGNVDVATVASWNDLTDKPFGEETVIKTFEFDGTLEGDPYLDLGEGVKIYYINDTILPHDCLVGSILRSPDIDSFEVTQDYLNASSSAHPMLYKKFDNVFIFQFTIFVAKADTTFDLFGVSIFCDKPGAYVLTTDEILPTPYSLTWTESTIHKLDPKFLPDYMEGVSF